MFQSIISQPGVGAGRFGAGVWVSLMVHAGVFAGVLGLSGRAAEELQPKVYEIGPMRRVVQSAPGNANPQPAPAPTPPPRPRTERKPPRELVQPVKIPPPPPLDETPRTEPSPSETLPAAPGGSTSHPSDSVQHESSGLHSPPNPTYPYAWHTNHEGAEEVLPFGASMTPPQLLSGAQLQYTREALEARVSGTAIARCTITREGDVENCRIIRGLPHMDEAVLDALTSRHYRPVSFQGQPVSVSYTFHVRLQLP
ncbi:protein TonB [Archangium gephyra]|uniref:Protein TonB n=1 Tax=Archangium gephyra TaxID=48 RepID=A0AAC8QCF1_9BACT|nr:energy transducer TonB [Archangium gephyra]AKJ04854.1 Ferric siderophore transport system, periplasmic binding protein TonB [Archangium gephyra]REG37101.1 protein TonB [Archangium gephyra]